MVNSVSFTQQSRSSCSHVITPHSDAEWICATKPIVIESEKNCKKLVASASVTADSVSSGRPHRTKKEEHRKRKDVYYVTGRLRLKARLYVPTSAPTISSISLSAFGNRRLKRYKTETRTDATAWNAEDLVRCGSISIETKYPRKDSVAISLDLSAKAEILAS